MYVVSLKLQPESHADSALFSFPKFYYKVGHFVVNLTFYPYSISKAVARELLTFSLLHHNTQCGTYCGQSHFLSL